jgi:hypothetical protein
MGFPWGSCCSIFSFQCIVLGTEVFEWSEFVNKNRQHNGKVKGDKGTIIDLQNTTLKTKDRAMRTQLSTTGKRMWSGGDTRRPLKKKSLNIQKWSSESVNWRTEKHNNFSVVFCRSMIVPLSPFTLPLCCLFLFTNSDHSLGINKQTNKLNWYLNSKTKIINETTRQARPHNCLPVPSNDLDFPAD